jgi:transcription antitermination protein NusB
VKVDRHHARILAMQALCQLDVQADDASDLTDALLAEAEADIVTRDYARRLVHLAWGQRQHFREQIQATRSAWDVERMSVVDRNVMRVAFAEWAMGGVPAKVVLDEAIEIAREYASAESAGFVNGVLDEVYGRAPREAENG